MKCAKKVVNLVTQYNDSDGISSTSDSDSAVSACPSKMTTRQMKTFLRHRLLARRSRKTKEKLESRATSRVFELSRY